MQNARSDSSVPDLIDDEELASVMRFLEEYQGKLKLTQSSLEGLELNFAVKTSPLILGMLGGVIGSMIIYSNYQRIDLVLAIGVGFIVLFALLLNTVIRYKRAEQHHKMELRMTQHLLERIIRMASQAAEHRKLNVPQRLELELRLAETEFAVEQASRHRHFGMFERLGLPS